MENGNARSINAVLSDLIQGNLRALEELQSRCRESLWALANVMLNNTGEGEEVVQDVFFKLWRNHAALKSDTNIDNYLFTLVRNECITVLRKRKSLKRKAAKFAYGLAYWYNFSSLENDELGRRLQSAISDLPPVERHYFISKYMHGESHKEIAERSNTTTQVVKNAVSRALKKLREKLDGKI